jgi:hypothetical protein
LITSSCWPSSPTVCSSPSGKLRRMLLSKYYKLFFQIFSIFQNLIH